MPLAANATRLHRRIASTGMESEIEKQCRVAMIKIEAIQSLTEFQRNTRASITQLKKTGRAAVLTVNGQAEIVVQDAHAYQRMFEKVEEVEQLLDLCRGIGECRAGSMRNVGEVLDAIEARHLPPDAARAGGRPEKDSRSHFGKESFRDDRCRPA